MRSRWSYSTGASALIAVFLCGALPAQAARVYDRDVYADVTPERVTLGNAVAERSWSRSGLVTLELRDKRRGGRVWSSGHPDFRLSVGHRSRATSSRCPARGSSACAGAACA